MANLILFVSLLWTLTSAFTSHTVRVTRRTVLFVASDGDTENAKSLKRRLLELGASYDRGYGATSNARDKVETTIHVLERLNPTTDAARGISTGIDSPLTGSWRMVWTTAQDVLVLGASPLATTGAIYQVFEPPIVTNIIDFIPKIQSLFPSSIFPQSLIRAEVTTRASPRPNMPMRIGLNFESVKLKPVQLLGMETDSLPPLAFDLPQIPGASSETSPGYFDVSYLDDEFLIIRQNAPGGLFVLVKTDDNRP
ncbi:PAP fibrillin [Fragilaria crotonensis]|nr:PAP fibrillin [Fragilaria crotonensis]